MDYDLCDKLTTSDGGGSSPDELMGWKAVVVSATLWGPEALFDGAGLIVPAKLIIATFKPSCILMKVLHDVLKTGTFSRYLSEQLQQRLACVLIIRPR